MRCCAQVGQFLTVSCGKKFGTAKPHTTSTVRMIAAASIREKYSIGSLTSPSAGGAFFVLHGLALGAHVRHHAAHLPHPHAVRDFDLDLVVVHHLGNLPDQSPRGDEDVAAAHVLDHVLVL